MLNVEILSSCTKHFHKNLSNLFCISLQNCRTGAFAAAINITSSRTLDTIILIDLDESNHSDVDESIQNLRTWRYPKLLTMQNQSPSILHLFFSHFQNPFSSHLAIVYGTLQSGSSRAYWYWQSATVQQLSITVLDLRSYIVILLTRVHTLLNP